MANAAQPASTRSATTPGKSNFGAAVPDSNHIGMVGDASWIQTQDATATTNLISPLSVTTGTVIPLVFPQNAIAVTLLALTNGVSVSEVSGATSLSQSFNLPAGIPITIPSARMQNLYLLGITGTSIVSFFFSIT